MGFPRRAERSRSHLEIVMDVAHRVAPWPDLERGYVPGKVVAEAIADAQQRVSW